MCRFVSYLGKHPIALCSLINHHENSLVHQSRKAKKTATGLNADGFGIGWYELFVDCYPAIFKSSQPAWNDPNLLSLSSKVCSRCFIGHIRASTVGGVSRENCHPFAFGKLLYAHNGTIRNFSKIKRALYNLIDDVDFELIKGQTDSEHFFALLSTIIRKRKDETLNGIKMAIVEAIDAVHHLQKKYTESFGMLANVLVTTGKSFLALRYSSEKEKPPLSLYYGLVDVQKEAPIPNFHIFHEHPNGIVIASEPLTQETAYWNEIPINHCVLVEENLEIRVSPYEN